MRDITDKGLLFLERWHDEMEENKPDSDYDIPPGEDLQLGKLQGQFLSLNTCNAAANLGEGIVKLIDDAAGEKE